MYDMQRQVFKTILSSLQNQADCQICSSSFIICSFFFFFLPPLRTGLNRESNVNKEIFFAIDVICSQSPDCSTVTKFPY